MVTLAPQGRPGARFHGGESFDPEELCRRLRVHERKQREREDRRRIRHDKERAAKPFHHTPQVAALSFSRTTTPDGSKEKCTSKVLKPLPPPKELGSRQTEELSLNASTFIAAVEAAKAELRMASGTEEDLAEVAKRAKERIMSSVRWKFDSPEPLRQKSPDSSIDPPPEGGESSGDGLPSSSSVHSSALDDESRTSIEQRRFELAREENRTMIPLPSLPEDWGLPTLRHESLEHNNDKRAQRRSDADQSVATEELPQVKTSRRRSLPLLSMFRR
ncbi:MAG: hypothetical protein M1833_004156 [Piccolia ochrophora]|nr:MAG: hypothetical protein M1833_004156 [Piccolia ochrophora]